MKILVTGGAGFIGANFIRFILGEYPEDEIICLDKLTYAANPDNISDLIGERLRFVKADICDREAVFGLLEENPVDCIVNFAAESHVDNSIKSPAVFFQSNIAGTTVLLDAVNKFNIARFHQISTDEVYGDTPIESRELFDEQSPLKPSSPYSASKAAADMIALSYFRTYKTPVTVSRCSNNYGPFQHREKLIPLMIYNAKNDLPLPIYGDGSNIRDWIYVGDHIRAVDMIIRNGRLGEVYNIGAGCELSNLELVKEILRRLDKPESLITFVADRKGHDLRYAICADKIKNELGWRAEGNLYEWLDEMQGY